MSFILFNKQIKKKTESWENRHQNLTKWTYLYLNICIPLVLGLPRSQSHNHLTRDQPNPEHNFSPIIKNILTHFDATASLWNITLLHPKDYELNILTSSYANRVVPMLTSGLGRAVIRLRGVLTITGWKHSIVTGSCISSSNNRSVRGKSSICTFYFNQYIPKLNMIQLMPIGIGLNIFFLYGSSFIQRTSLRSKATCISICIVRWNIIVKTCNINCATIKFSCLYNLPPL